MCMKETLETPRKSVSLKIEDRGCDKPKIDHMMQLRMMVEVV